MNSHDTVQKYFEFLSYSFIVSTQYEKIYPIDPIITKVIGIFSGKTIDIRHRIEMIILRHLLNSQEVSMFGLDLIRWPYFWSSDKGKEIDFVEDTKTTLLPLEVKYQNTISPGDYIGMRKVFGKGIIMTKSTIFIDGGIVGIPAWLFVSLVK